MTNRVPTFSLQRIIFLVVSLVLCVQVGWWINVQIRESGRLLQARTQALKANCAQAWQMDSLNLLGSIHTRADPASLEQRRQTIRQNFPHVAVVPSPLSRDDLALLNGAGYLTLRPEPMIELVFGEANIAIPKPNNIMLTSTDA